MPVLQFKGNRVIETHHNTDLLDSAAEQQRHFDESTSPSDRSGLGHFGTPSVIAKFMAGMFSKIPRGTIRILDAGAGVGTLSAALCQRILAQKSRRRIVFNLWENAPQFEPHLRVTMDHCQKRLRDAGHQMEYVVHVGDFILENAHKPLFHNASGASFDLAILNPPYYKLRKVSAHARAMQHVVHGQPNMYALFMAVAADMMIPGGEMVAITPRSYFNGPYFKRFRKWFFERMAARHVHVFGSRTEAFRDDNVLQETIILLAEKGGCPREVVLTSSAGREFRDVGRCSIPYNNLIGDANGDHVIRVTTNHFDHEIVAALDCLPHRFRSRGFQISTGPVVTFRSKDFLRHEQAEDTAPLLWMHNVRPFVTRFPPKIGKPAHIAISEASKRLLVPAMRYVLLKRFTAKEEKRRLVAGIVETDDVYSEWLGLENHLNYIYRKGSELGRSEAFGLAAFFNSVLVDRYFRAISGNTQVNATEIRVMPVPDEHILSRIGDEIQRVKTRDFHTVECIVGRMLHLPRRLIEQLCEAAQ